MTISGISLNDSLASLATNMKGGELALQLAVAIMKQLQDQQNQQAQALLQMIANSPTADGTGTIVNLAA